MVEKNADTTTARGLERAETEAAREAAVEAEAGETAEPTGSISRRRRRAGAAGPTAMGAPVTGSSAPSEAEGPHPVTDLVRADHVTVSQGAVGRIEASDASITQGAVGMVRADSASLTMGGAGLVAADRVTLTMGGAQTILARESVTMEQSGAVTVMAGHVEMRPQSGAIFVIARRVEGELNALFDWRGALAFGAAFGLVFGLVRGARRRR